MVEADIGEDFKDLWGGAVLAGAVSSTQLQEGGVAWRVWRGRATGAHAIGMAW
jgi:hypothetical protein